MSGRNGDKSRFNRERKRRIHRRERNRKLLEKSAEPTKNVAADVLAPGRKA